MIRFVCYWNDKLTHFNMGDDEEGGNWPTRAPTKLVVVDFPGIPRLKEKIDDALARTDRAGFILGEFMLQTTWAPKGQKENLIAFLDVLKNLRTNKIKICWHSTILTPWFAEQYAASNLDYLFIESYWPWKSNFMLWLFFKLNYLMAKKQGLEKRMVFGLGVNQGEGDGVHGPDIWSRYLKWCNDEKTMRRQMEYIKKNCPGIAGIAFYNPKVNDDFWEVMDRVTYEYFPD